MNSQVVHAGRLPQHARHHLVPDDRLLVGVSGARGEHQVATGWRVVAAAAPASRRWRCTGPGTTSTGQRRTLVGGVRQLVRARRCPRTARRRTGRGRTRRGSVRRTAGRRASLPPGTPSGAMNSIAQRLSADTSTPTSLRGRRSSQSIAGVEQLGAGAGELVVDPAGLAGCAQGSRPSRSRRRSAASASASTRPAGRRGRPGPDHLAQLAGVDGEVVRRPADRRGVGLGDQERLLPGPAGQVGLQVQPGRAAPADEERVQARPAGLRRRRAVPDRPGWRSRRWCRRRPAARRSRRCPGRPGPSATQVVTNWCSGDQPADQVGLPAR